MKQEQLQQAQHLYFQTDLSKSEIASMLGISRRTMHYWAHDNQWDHIKKSAATMPVMLAENCYFIMAKMQQDILSETRSDKAPTYQEVNALYKLMLTINKLKSRTPLNETLEMSTHFMEFVNDQSPEAADLIKPFIDGYIASRAKVQPKLFTPSRVNDHSSPPAKQDIDREAQLDLEDLAYWAENPESSPYANEIVQSDQPKATTKPSPLTTQSEPPVFTNRQVVNTTPKNEKLLNRAQRRQLARTKAAA